MGFLRDMEDGKEDDFDENEGPKLEEKYMRLFMKIGRDFVHKDDFAKILTEIIEALNDNNLDGIDLESSPGADDRAQEYRDYINSNIQGSDSYPDLINLSED
jgi:hypothetical protein